MFKLILSLFISTSLFGGAINIALSANVSYVIDELKKEFNKLHPNTKVRVTIGGSGKLTAQIKHNAPYHLFMSADMSYPQALYSEGITTTKPQIYAKGSLAYLSNRAIDFSKGLELLRDKNIKRVAIANPKTAPYGRATVKALKKAGVYEDIKHKFIYGESISQTLSYTITATEIGFIAKSSLYSPKLAKFREGVHWMEVDKELYKPIHQGIVILKRGASNPEVKAFYDFILSDKAKVILKKFGYIVS